ncbi:MAG: hypothetical protein Q8O52_16870 [Sulfuritalea sp.]|nr:hypothetical protein [Sulfuritalea sp.]
MTETVAVPLRAFVILARFAGWAVLLLVPGMRWFFRRRINYDNERGKGDHRHLEGREEQFSFSIVATLVADFLSVVKRVRGES